MNARAYSYLKDPAAIYRLSFETVRREVDLTRFPEALRPLVVRIVHSCGIPEIAADLAWAGDVAKAARQAARLGAALLVDARMVQAGIIAERLPHPARVICTLDDPACCTIAADLGTTRSAAAVDLWRPHLGGAVVVIGNAPTALFHLLERLATWHERPAAILAFPVGFVGAAESKEALIEESDGIPFVTLRGRRGGSAVAAAAVNALMAEA